MSQAAHVDLTVLSLWLTALPLMSTYNNAHVCRLPSMGFLS